jgi:hypothetical protein
MFTGEVNQLSGRRSLVRCRAREMSTLIEIGRQHLRGIMQTDPLSVKSSCVHSSRGVYIS